MRFDEAFDNLVDYCAERSSRLAALTDRDRDEVLINGYDIWIPAVVKEYAGQDEPTRGEYRPFYDAAWELCRMGILRPGPDAPTGVVGTIGVGRPVVKYNPEGYSITGFGQEWLADPERRAYGDPSRWSEILSSYESKYGSGFAQRAIEAVRCYRTRNHLAACAMAGAAAESILLAVAIAKVGDEDKVLNVYTGPRGRSSVTEQVVSGVKKSTTSQFEAALKSLHYWRDEAAHGKATTISDIESWASLIQLLQLARLCSDRWAELTG